MTSHCPQWRLLRVGAYACFAVLPLLSWAAPPRAGVCGKIVISADPNYPPLHWYDGTTLQGASIEVVTRVFSSLRQPYEVRYVGPLKRVLALAQHGDIDVVATLKKTPEREAYLAFGATPALSNPVAAFVAVRRPFAFHGWNDLIARRGAMALGNVFGGTFDDFMRARLHVSVASDVNQIFKQLAYGRVDYVVIGLYPGLAWMASHGRDGEFGALKPYLTDAGNYVAFARASPCAHWLPAFDARLVELRRQGAFDHLSERYLDVWRQAPHPESHD